MGHSPFEAYFVRMFWVLCIKLSRKKEYIKFLFLNPNSNEVPTLVESALIWSSILIWASY